MCVHGSREVVLCVADNELDYDKSDGARARVRAMGRGQGLGLGIVLGKG